MTAIAATSLLPTYPATRVTFTDGLGTCLYDGDGRGYLDFAAGIAVNSTGHAHPKVAAAIGAQAERFIHAQIGPLTHLGALCDQFVVAASVAQHAGPCGTPLAKALAP